MENDDVLHLEIDTFLMRKMSFIGTMQKVFGVLAVIVGAFTCIGIVTAIIGIPYILSGIKLYKSGNAFAFAAYSKDGKFMREALLNLAGFWKYVLIIVLLTILLYIILLVLLFILSSYGYLHRFR